MLYHRFIPDTWRRFFTGRSGAKTSTTPDAPAPHASTASSGAQPSWRPAPVPGTEDFWLAVAASRLPESAQPVLEEGLWLAVRYRAYWSLTGKAWPDERPDEQPEWRRFGLYGEQLVPRTTQDIQGLLGKELKRAAHTLEDWRLSRSERQRRMLMHGARLEQLYRDLARRFGARVPLEELRQALDALLA